MKICFIADANTIHARRWVEYFCKPENEIHILSTDYCIRPIEGAIIHNLSVPRNGIEVIDGIALRKKFFSSEFTLKKRLTNNVRQFVYRRSHKLEPFYLSYLGYKALALRRKAKILINELNPDLIHCLRLPIEGYLGGLIGYRPLAISSWGHDLVYNARKHFIQRWLTRITLSKTDLYFPDNTRDKYIAEVYGFSPLHKSHVILATGGLKLEKLPLYSKDYTLREKLGFDLNTNLIISTRGFKFFYINTEALVKAIPRIVEVFPNSVFVIDGNMKYGGYSYIKGLAEDLKVEKYIRFTNRMEHQKLMDYLSASDIMVSVTTYDGWSISMLEGMAYGVIPIMSNHSPIQEWIRDGWNGYLINPIDPYQISKTIIRALKNRNNFEVMWKRNWDLLREKANYYENMKIVEELYDFIISKYPHSENQYIIKKKSNNFEVKK